MMKRCQKCEDRDVTVQFRQRSMPGLRVLCAACNVDVNTSSTRAVVVPEREQHDRYAQMAARHNVR